MRANSDMLKHFADKVMKFWRREKKSPLDGLSDEGLQKIARTLVSKMSSEDLFKVYSVVGGDRSFRLSVPDPNIGYLGQPEFKFRFWNQDVHINNAGMRSSRDYGPKPDNVHRIIFLGDSYIFGDGIAEEDRFPEQVKKFLDENEINFKGKEIEVISLGLGGWNMVQETSYLIPRLSEYDPDTVVMLVLENDLGPNLPFSHGLHANRYSPEERAFGSSYLSAFISTSFNDKGAHSALAWFDTPHTVAYWNKALAGLKKLENLLTDRGSNLLVTGMCAPESRPFPFIVRLQEKLRLAGVRSPYLPVTFFRSKERLVIGDTHPNAAGHLVLRDQYLRALYELGWLPLPTDKVPDRHPGLTFEIDEQLRRGHYEKYVTDFRNQSVLQDFDFNNFLPIHSRSFIAGILPPGDGDPATPVPGEPPWASTRAIFVMKPPPDRPDARFKLDIDIPKRQELFPLNIEIVLDAKIRKQFQFETPQDGGHRSLEVLIDQPLSTDVVEIAIFSDNFISSIDNHSMRCFRLLRARYQ